MSVRSLNGLNGTTTSVVITNRMLTTLPLEMTQPLFTDPIILSMKGLTGLGTGNQIMKMNSAGTQLIWGTDNQENISVSLPLDRTGDVISLTGLTTLGTSNQIIKMNAGATALEYATENQENISVSLPLDRTGDIISLTGLTTLGTAGQIIKMNAGATALEYATENQENISVSLPLDRTGDVISLTGLTTLGTSNQIIKMNAGGTALEYATENQENISVVSPLFRSGDVISLKNLNSFGSNNQILSTNGVDTCSWITPTDTTYTGSGFVSINASNVISLTLTSNSQLSNGALYITKDSTDILTNKTLTDPIINRIIGSTIGYALIVPDTKAGTIALTNDIPSVPTYTATSPLLLSGTTFSLQNLSGFGTNGQVLSTNGSNTLSWTTPSTVTSEWSSAGNLLYPATSSTDTIYLADSSQAIITLTDTYVVASASKGFTIEANNTNRTFEITSVDTNIPIFKFYENTGYLDWGLISASRMNFGYNVLYGADTAYGGLGTIANIYVLTLKAKYTTTDSLTIANSSGFQVALYASSTGSNVLKIGAKMELGEVSSGNMYILDPASSVSTNNWKLYYNTASTLTYVNCGSSSGSVALCVAGTPKLTVSNGDVRADSVLYARNYRIDGTTGYFETYAEQLMYFGSALNGGNTYFYYNQSSAQIISAGTWSTWSDKRLKTDIQTGDDINKEMADYFDKIDINKYGYIPAYGITKNMTADERAYGFIAQQVESVYPQGVSNSGTCVFPSEKYDGDIPKVELDDVKVISKDSINMLLWGKIKDLDKTVKKQEGELNVYKEIVNKLINATSFKSFKESLA